MHGVAPEKPPPVTLPPPLLHFATAVRSWPSTPRPHAVPPASVHWTEVGVNDGENPGGQGLGLNFVLHINFCIFPHETCDRKSETSRYLITNQKSLIFFK